MSLSSLEMPCLLLDRGNVASNLASLRRRMGRLGVALRVHGKTAKNIDVVIMRVPPRPNTIVITWSTARPR